jgi:aminodeoxyfutalosine deaminase
MTASVPTPKTYRAHWVWSGGRWLESGRITLAGRRIIAVGTERVAGEIDLGDQIILPGLVNAHTHLEFSGLTAPLPYEHTFASWIRHVVQWRRGQTDESARTALQQGIAESARAGVSLLGEIATREWDEPAALDVSKLDLTYPSLQRPQIVVFDEVLGLKPEAVAPQMSDARRHIRVGSTRPADAVLTHRGQIDWRPSWTAGLSPHAPYSISRELFAEVLDLATQWRCPVAMHLAETQEELELLSSGTGPLVDLFTDWGLWSPGQRAAFRTPLEVLQQLSTLPRVLVIHGNYLNTKELDLLAGKDQFSVVYCPRTHSYFQHDRYPLAELLQRGIRVALGTDSRASNPDLNLLPEVRHIAQRHPEIAPSTLLEMATRHGAEALGLGHAVGRIAPGWRADFCVLPIAPSLRDPFEAVLAP